MYVGDIVKLYARYQYLIWYCMDREVSFCNIYVIQQDTQYLMINFIRNIQ